MQPQPLGYDHHQPAGFVYKMQVDQIEAGRSEVLFPLSWFQQRTDNRPVRGGGLVMEDRIFNMHLCGLKCIFNIFHGFACQFQRT